LKKKYNKVFMGLLLLGGFVGETCAKIILHKDDELTVDFSGKIANSTDFHNNASLLNGTAKGARGNKVDRAFANKTKVELTTHAEHKAGLEAKATLRSKLTWGAPRSFTSSASIKYGEALIGNHSHTLERNNIYIQQAWISFSLDKLGGCNLWNQKFKIGLFPFELGRGIALGDAFAV